MVYKNAQAFIESKTIVEDLPFPHKNWKMNGSTFAPHTKILCHPFLIH